MDNLCQLDQTHWDAHTSPGPTENTFTIHRKDPFQKLQCKDARLVDPQMISAWVSDLTGYSASVYSGDIMVNRAKQSEASNSQVVTLSGSSGAGTSTPVEVPARRVKYWDPVQIQNL